MRFRTLYKPKLFKKLQTVRGEKSSLEKKPFPGGRRLHFWQRVCMKMESKVSVGRIKQK